MASSRISDALASILSRAVKNRRFRPVLNDLLADPEARDEIMHRLGTNLWHTSERIDEVMPPDLNLVEGLGDMLWLFSSNYANRGNALLMLDEASWLFDKVSSMPNPRVVEVGRAKGGTTFLLAAAGASVLSIDNGAQEAANERRFGPGAIGYDAALTNALRRAGLENRVDLVVADAITFQPPDGEFDLIYVDVMLPTETLAPIVERWWEALKPGATLVLRDGREPRVPSQRAIADRMRHLEQTTMVEPAPGVFTVIEKASSGQESTELSIDLTESKSAKIVPN